MAVGGIAFDLDCPITRRIEPHEAIMIQKMLAGNPSGRYFETTQHWKFFHDYNYNVKVALPLLALIHEKIDDVR